MEKSERRESGSENKGTNKERDFEDDYYMHNIVLFTAGAAVLMACLKRAVVVFLLKEWRAWVFVVLNLVLLAILFTSSLSNSNDDKECSKNESNDNSGEKTKNERNKKIRRQRSKEQCWPEQVVVTKRQESGYEECRKSVSRCDQSQTTSSRNEEAFCKEDEIEAPRLSKEELNERAEAFIMMFRQHLVLDARKCGKHLFKERPERVDRVNFQTACSR
ncbi:uncharacterized protein LOC133816134 [Humulus lupulus]|uniref:uncharacterized protein LOC133816134 n=1 Tax=Humulus lupulus TaxID=3486 RepID=UPI002B4173A6|nr:uncharacterized protein LOC133816134 [Humulus lupulus]